MGDFVLGAVRAEQGPLLPSALGPSVSGRGRQADGGAGGNRCCSGYDFQMSFCTGHKPLGPEGWSCPLSFSPLVFLNWRLEELGFHGTLLVCGSDQRWDKPRPRRGTGKACFPSRSHSGQSWAGSLPADSLPAPPPGLEFNSCSFFALRTSQGWQVPTWECPLCLGEPVV